VQPITLRTNPLILCAEAISALFNAAQMQLTDSNSTSSIGKKLHSPGKYSVLTAFLTDGRLNAVRKRLRFLANWRSVGNRGCERLCIEVHEVNWLNSCKYKNQSAGPVPSRNDNSTVASPPRLSSVWPLRRSSSRCSVFVPCSSDLRTRCPQSHCPRRRFALGLGKGGGDALWQISRRLA
jgi:hypothetical protein